MAITRNTETIQALENKGNASVPINQTGEYERHTKGDTLEFVSLQADALNAPPCEGADSQSGKSISYSIGAERVQHADFYLPKIGFLLYGNITHKWMSLIKVWSVHVG